MSPTAAADGCACASTSTVATARVSRVVREHAERTADSLIAFRSYWRPPGASTRRPDSRGYPKDEHRVAPRHERRRLRRSPPATGGGGARPMAGLRAQRHIATRPGRKLGAVSARVGPVALQRPEYPDLARVLSVARRRLWVILLAGLAFAALTRVAVGGPASYQAETTILVGPVGGTYQDLRASGQQAETYAQLATAGPVLVETARRLGTGVTVADLRRHITASADDVTRLLTLTVTAQSPRQAAAIAQAVTQELRVFTRAPSSAPPADSGGLTAHGMRVVNPPQPPSSAFGTFSHNALVGLAFFAGALFALALLVVRDAAKRRLLREEDLATASPAPVLGALAPRRGRGRGRARADRAAHVVAGRM